MHDSVLLVVLEQIKAFLAEGVRPTSVGIHGAGGDQITINITLQRPKEEKK